MKKNSLVKFRKSSFSHHGSPRCVEVSITSKEVLIRNSRFPKKVISFTLEEWEAFVAGVKNNEFVLRK